MDAFVDSINVERKFRGRVPCRKRGSRGEARTTRPPPVPDREDRIATRRGSYETCHALRADRPLGRRFVRRRFVRGLPGGKKSPSPRSLGSGRGEGKGSQRTSILWNDSHPFVRPRLRTPTIDLWSGSHEIPPWHGSLLDLSLPETSFRLGRPRVEPYEIHLLTLLALPPPGRSSTSILIPVPFGSFPGSKGNEERKKRKESGWILPFERTIQDPSSRGKKKKGT